MICVTPSNTWKASLISSSAFSESAFSAIIIKNSGKSMLPVPSLSTWFTMSWSSPIILLKHSCIITWISASEGLRPIVFMMELTWELSTEPSDPAFLAKYFNNYSSLDHSCQPHESILINANKTDGETRGCHHSRLFNCTKELNEMLILIKTSDLRDCDLYNECLTVVQSRDGLEKAFFFICFDS